MANQPDINSNMVEISITGGNAISKADLTASLKTINEIVADITKIHNTIQTTAELLIKLFYENNMNNTREQLRQKCILICNIIQVVINAETAIKCLGKYAPQSLNNDLQSHAKLVTDQLIITEKIIGQTQECNYDQLGKNIVLLSSLIVNEILFIRTVIRYQISMYPGI
jgi:hypothetical protein